MSDQIKCPRCQSSQVAVNKKGFSGGKALAGATLTGGIGLLAGTIGSNKVKITCLSCAKVFKPGEDYESKKKLEAQMNTNSGKIIQVIAGVITFVIFILFIKACS